MRFEECFEVIQYKRFVKQIYYFKEKKIWISTFKSSLDPAYWLAVKKFASYQTCFIVDKLFSIVPVL